MLLLYIALFILTHFFMKYLLMIRINIEQDERTSDEKQFLHMQDEKSSFPQKWVFHQKKNSPFNSIPEFVWFELTGQWSNW